MSHFQSFGEPIASLEWLSSSPTFAGAGQMDLPLSNRAGREGKRKKRQPAASEPPGSGEPRAIQNEMRISQWP